MMSAAMAHAAGVEVRALHRTALQFGEDVMASADGVQQHEHAAGE